MMKEILRLTQENNRMLHSMRRSAYLHTIFKLVLYGAIALGSLWIYITYVAPLVMQMLETVQKVQGTSAQAQAQFSDFQNMLKNFSDKFKTSTTSHN